MIYLIAQIARIRSYQMGIMATALHNIRVKDIAMAWILLCFSRMYHMFMVVHERTKDLQG